MSSLYEYMECLREEYKGLELTDEQILTAKSNDITPEQIFKIREVCGELRQAFDEMLQYIRSVVSNICSSKEFKMLLKNTDEFTNEESKDKRNKKGKKNKNWEKKSFYQ